MPLSEKLFLGIDGGGTKTEAVIIDENEQVRAVGLGGESNAHFTGDQIAQDSFTNAISEALRIGAVSAGDIQSACCTFGSLAASAFSTLGITVRAVSVSEANVAFERAGIDVPRGVALIAGTGSSCIGCGDGGRHAGAGGWGALIGDDGSAYDIGIKGIRSALAVTEGRGPTTALGQKVCDYFDLDEARHVIGKLGGGNVYQALIAGFAKKVSEAANEGDNEAIKILESASEDLGELVAFVARQVFGHDDVFPIVLAGGVFNAGKLVIDPIKSIITPQFPNARIIVAQMRPGEAVARLARRAYMRRQSKC